MIPLKRTCKEVAALLIAREDRDLPVIERMALKVHMRICDACPRFERQIMHMKYSMRMWRSYVSSDDPGT